MDAARPMAPFGLQTTQRHVLQTPRRPAKWEVMGVSGKRPNGNRYGKAPDFVALLRTDACAGSFLSPHRAGQDFTARHNSSREVNRAFTLSGKKLPEH
jgi:hypothetical protein